MENPFPAGRSRGVTVAVEGFFAFVWFGWGQANAPSWLVIPLAVGTALGALLAVAGVVVAKRSPGPLPAASDPAVRRRYGIIVGLEFGLLAAGAAVLGVTGLYQWVPTSPAIGIPVDDTSESGISSRSWPHRGSRAAIRPCSARWAVRPAPPP